MKEHNIRTRILEITPAWAERKLAELQNLIEQDIFRQRPINRRLVEAYASEMVSGTWGLSHQGIGFDEEGRLIDGQHRLWAVIRANIPVNMMVTTGIPSDTNGNYKLPTMDIIDRGRNRSTGQQMTIAHGIANATQVAATCRNIGFIYTNSDEVKMSLSQTLFVYDLYKSHIESIFGFTEHNKQKVGTIIAPLAVYHGTHQEKAREFARGFFSKEGLLKGSPILGAIKWVETHPTSVGGRAARISRAGAIAYCIHQFHHDQPVDTVSPKEEAVYWLAALNKKHGELIRKCLYPLRKG